MPTYVYRCPDGHERDVVHRMADDPTVKCNEAVYEDEGPQYHPCEKRMARVPAAVVSLPLINTRSFDRADGYQATLASRPNDPDAYTSGQRSLQKLIDKRLREGWIDQGRVGDIDTSGKRRAIPSAIDVATAKVQEGKAED